MQSVRTQPWQSLHESTRRALCQIVFVVGGALPFVLTVVCAALQFTPIYHKWQASRWESWIEQKCGLRVQVAAVEHLAPLHVKLHGVQFAHQESGAFRGRIRQIELSSAASKYEVRLLDVSTQAEHLREIWQCWHETFLCKVGKSWPSIHVTAEGISLRGMNPSDDRFSQATAHIHSTSNGARAAVQFRGKGPKESETLSLDVQRYRSESSLVTRIDLTSGKHCLPSLLLSQFIPEIRDLGESTEFAGKVTMDLRTDGWQIHLRDTFVQGLDLGKWTSNLLTPVTGRGRLEIAEAHVSERGVRSAHGSLRAENGKISQSLLSEAYKYLQVRLTNEVLAANVSLQSYETLGLDYKISDAGILIEGNLVSANPNWPMAPGTFLADQTGNLAATSHPHPFSCDHIIAVVALAGGQVQSTSVEGTNLPIGSDGWRIARWLPMRDRAVVTIESSNDPIRLSRSN